MLSLIADQERDAKLDNLSDPLAAAQLDRHVDFAALAAEIDRLDLRPSRASIGPSGPLRAGKARTSHSSNSSCLWGGKH